MDVEATLQVFQVTLEKSGNYLTLVIADTSVLDFPSWFLGKLTTKYRARGSYGPDHNE